MPRSKIEMIRTAVTAAVHFAVTQPTKFWSKFRQHMWILLPLIATQLLQKLQDLVDDRLMNALGLPALTIHNVQGSLYALSQEIGLISATSLLIFWKRKETVGKQRSVLILHLFLTLFLTLFICFFTYKNTSTLCRHFNVPDDYLGTAETYLQFGIANLILRALYVPVNTILIAVNQRMRSVVCICTIVALKSLLAWYCAASLWNKQVNVQSVTQPMLVYSVGASILSIGLLFYSTRWIFKLADGWGPFSIWHTLRVWPGEIGIGAVSALSPLFFSFQIAKVNTAPGFFVTYQIALHLTCLLTLPVLAGIQVAVRDASAEHSEATGVEKGAMKPLHKSKWWPKFFFASLIPTTIGLSFAAMFPAQIIHWIYGYEIPKEHYTFLPIFFAAWIFFQFGSVFLIMLRASQRNHVATRNIMISGFLVQIGLTQILIWMGVCTSLGVGLVLVASCVTYMLLNWHSAFKLQLRWTITEPLQKGLSRLIKPKGSTSPTAAAHSPSITLPAKSPLDSHREAEI